MVAPKGTHPFTSAQSRDAEEKASRLIKSEIANRPDFELKSCLTFQDVLGTPPTFAYTAGGKPTTMCPDPGFILHKGKIAAIPEVKYQKEPQNAVERCFRWMAVASLPNVQIPYHRLFFAFYGDAFRQNEHGHIPGQSGGVIELCMQLPIRLLVNATENEVLKEFKAFLDEIAS